MKILQEKTEDQKRGNIRRIIGRLFVPTGGHEGDDEAGHTPGEVGGGHEGAPAHSVHQQVEDESGGQLHQGGDEEVQEEIVTGDPQPQDQALKHNSARKPASKEYRVRCIF